MIYCKTTDSPKKVGEAICKANSTAGLSWIITEEIEADTWAIQTQGERCTHALVYRIGASVVAAEVDADCAPYVVEPLLEIYGFENIKWLSTLETGGT